MQVRVQQDIIKIANKVYDDLHLLDEKTKWTVMNKDIADYLIKETQAARKSEQPLIRQITEDIQVVQAMDKKYGPDNGRMEYRKRLHRDLHKAKHPDLPNIAEAFQALPMYQREETGSAATYTPYKTISKQSWINELRTGTWDDGVPPFTGKTKSAKGPAETLQDYYTDLFSPKEIDESKAYDLLKNFPKKIFKKSAKKLEEPISEEEIRDVVEHLPEGKQAGPNRVPNLVYKTLSNIFVPRLFNLFHEVRMAGELPETFLQGDISVMYKKKERDDPRNYRPITLLNGDYNIYTRILARRMLTVVHEFVSECQKGFVPDTFIAEVSMLVNLIKAYVNEEGTDRKGLMVFLDMEKAFDRVSYKFLMDGMKAVGFGPKFTKYVQMLYNEQKAPKRRIYANGYYSGWFDIKSGVAQGCPLSPLLFLIVGEALRTSLKMEKLVRGIKIGNTRNFIAQFADDTALFLTDHSELAPAFRAIKTWCKATGMRENESKREGLAMGTYRRRMPVLAHFIL